MNRKYFTEEQIEELKKNPYVKKVTEKTVNFTKEFKEHFINEINDGKGPHRIFVESGINPYILGNKRIDTFSNRIRTKYKNNQPFDDNRGKKSTGRPKKIKKKELSIEEQLDKLKYENLMLKAENELLKKMKFLIEQKELKNLQRKKDTN